MIMVASIHDENYQELAKLTFEQNKKLYCARHNYPLIAKVGDFSSDYPIHFDKMSLILDAFEENQEIIWAYWLDCDALITNLEVRLESIIDDNYHIIIATDWNGLNTGSFLVKNSIEGKNWLKFIYEQRFIELYQDHPWHEQLAIINHFQEFSHLFKIVPQRTFNSYDFDFYQLLSGTDYPRFDKLGTNGQWKEGDFVVHFPGLQNNDIIKYIKNYLEKQIKNDKY